ncbi:hypothetical protein, partial [Actinomadura darangshiensis]|uniref:hypothetical protein n=1 Tax=Actinomadura darangshiensis TaxID=705336 RepID=UPI001A9F0BC9
SRETSSLTKRRPLRRTHAVQPREKHHGARRPRPHATRKPRTARPAAPSWIAAECRRRFPDDPLRRRYCVAALTRTFMGAARG